MSLFYVAGMILNDAFDVAYDTTFRASRPIPSGAIGERVALGVGFALLALGAGGVTLIGGLAERSIQSLVSAAALAATIVVYDVHHKKNPAGPVLMGFCRGLLYVTVALTQGELRAPLLIAAGVQTAYVVGLTYAAKQEDLASPGSWWPLGLILAVVGYVAVVWIRGPAIEHELLVGVALVGYLAWLGFAIRPLFSSPRRIGEGVGRLIAGVAAVDALILSLTGDVWATLLVAAGLFCTRLLHRVVPGT